MGKDTDRGNKCKGQGVFIALGKCFEEIRKAEEGKKKRKKEGRNIIGGREVIKKKLIIYSKLLMSSAQNSLSPNPSKVDHFTF